MPAPMCAQVTVTWPAQGSTPQWATARACAVVVSASEAGTGTSGRPESACATAGTIAMAIRKQRRRRGTDGVMGVVATLAAPHPSRRRSQPPCEQPVDVCTRSLIRSRSTQTEELARALGHQLGVLLGNEVPALGHDLDAHVVGVLVRAVEQDDGDGRVAGADH